METFFQIAHVCFQAAEKLAIWPGLLCSAAGLGTHNFCSKSPSLIALEASFRWRIPFQHPWSLDILEPFWTRMVQSIPNECAAALSLSERKFQFFRHCGPIQNWANGTRLIFEYTIQLAVSLIETYKNELLGMISSIHVASLFLCSKNIIVL